MANKITQHTPQCESAGNMLIGGIPAYEFLHRRVKFWGSRDTAQHAVPAIVCGFHNGRKVSVKPKGHRIPILIYPEQVVPLWSHNDDLRQKYKIVLPESPAEQGFAALPPAPVKPQTVEQVFADLPPAPVKPQTVEQVFADLPPAPAKTPVPAIPKPTVTMHQPPVSKPATKPVATAPAEMPANMPPIILRSLNMDWVPLYHAYAALLREDQCDLELIEEARKALEARIVKKQELAAKLEAVGVQLLDAQPPAVLQPAEVQKPVLKPETHAHAPGHVQRRTAVENDAMVDSWAERVRKELLEARVRGETKIIHLSVAYMRKELAAIGWKTLSSRAGRLRKQYGLQFFDNKGNTGANASRDIQIRLAE